MSLSLAIDTAITVFRSASAPFAEATARPCSRTSDGCMAAQPGHEGLGNELCGKNRGYSPGILWRRLAAGRNCLVFLMFISSVSWSYPFSEILIAFYLLRVIRQGQGRGARGAGGVFLSPAWARLPKVRHRSSAGRFP